MVPLTSLYGRIDPYLASKASTPLVRQALVDTVIDFFDRTNVLQSTLPAQDVSATVAEYEITPPAGHVLVAPLTVFLNKQRLPPTSEQELDLAQAEQDAGPSVRNYLSWVRCNGVEDWRYATAPQPTSYFVSNETGALRLVPIPETNYVGPLGLIVKASWKPLPDVTQISDAIYGDHYQTLVEGAVGRLMMVPSKPWTDMKGGAIHMGVYESAVGDAASEVRRNVKRADRSAYRSVAYK